MILQIALAATMIAQQKQQYHCDLDRVHCEQTTDIITPTITLTTPGLTVASGSTSGTVRIADPDEQIAVGGRVTTIREYMAQYEAMAKLLKEAEEIIRGLAEDARKTEDDAGELHVYHITGAALKETVSMKAHSRLEALTRLGLTVWTEHEWKECGEICSPEKK